MTGRREPALQQAGFVGFSCRVICEPDNKMAVVRLMESRDYREMSGLSGLMRESTTTREAEREDTVGFAAAATLPILASVAEEVLMKSRPVCLLMICPLRMTISLRAEYCAAHYLEP